MITITWNNADFGAGYSDDIRSIDFDVEQLYKVNKNNDVPQFRTESTFTVQDTVVHKPDEIECALILTEDARIPVPNGDTSYGVLSRLSDSGVPFSIDASEQGTFMSYDNVVIKSMSNMVQIGVKYICRLIFSEIRTATAEIADEIKVVTDDEFGDVYICETQLCYAPTAVSYPSLTGGNYLYNGLSIGSYSLSDDVDKIKTELINLWEILT